MFRKYVIITLAAVLFLGTASCTSKKAESDGADVEAGIEDDESLESAEATEKSDDLSTDEGGGGSESAGGGGDNAVADMGGDELAPDEKLPEDGGKVAENSEVTSDDLSETPAGGSEGGDQLAASEPPPPSATPEPTPSEPPPIDTAASEPPPAGTPEPDYEAPKPATMSLKKVAAQPWKVGKTLANAVYIVRDGDTAESISQKVFGSTDKVKELCKVNSYNCNRGLKVGDKMYYNSPQRPTDDAVVKTFYEDAGIAPQSYTAKSGDNIRKLGKQLLGHERSWMELWATNEVESKGDLDEGTHLKYWPTETATPTQTMASNDASPAPPAEGAPPAESGMPPADAGMPPQDMAAMPPQDAGAPPPQDMAAAPPPTDQMPSDLPPPPDQAAAGTVEPPPPPPPPPPPATDNQASAEAGAEMQDPNQTMVLGVGAVLLLAAAALFISIRKKRQRRAIDFNTTTQTQIE